MSTPKQPAAATFEIMLRNDDATMDAIGHADLSPQAVREMIEKELRGFVVERMKQYGMEARIEAMLERRIEVAVKAAVDGAQATLVAAAVARIKERLRTQIDAMKITVTVNLEG